MNQLRYKNYIGSVFFSEEDEVFHGKVIGISDSISFEGDSVKGLTEDFHNAIDEYLEFCTDVGKEPEISMHSVMISPEIFNRATTYANRKGLPLNEFIEEMLESNIRA